MTKLPTGSRLTVAGLSRPSPLRLLRVRGGFTMLEILLVLSLLAAMAGIVLSNADNLLTALEYIPPERRFRDIAAEARLIAAETGKPATLSYNPDTGRFVLNVADGRADAVGNGTENGDADALDGPSHASLRAPKDDQRAPEAPLFEGGPSTADYRYDDLTVEFFPLLSQDETANFDRTRYARDAAAQLEFHPNGTATAAKVRFTFGNSTPRELTLDTFSAGPLRLPEGADRF